MIKFEVGKTYGAYEAGFDHIKILKRTEKTVWVDNGTAQWRMRIWIDKYDVECCTDSSVPKKWKPAFTYKARFLEK